MATAGRHFGVVLRRIERIFTAGSVAGLSEGQLLERFATARDEAAFEAILARHGPMVLGICRQVLRDPADVEDAFQATFLVLVRKAGTLRNRDLLGNWLFGVASRVALRARAVAARRRTVEDPEVLADRLAPEDEQDRESRLILHEELRRLPGKYRTPILLCYLEGLTHEEAARQLGWPVGTVKGRLARAREMLGRRLTRRGLAMSVPAVLTANARAAVPAGLFESTTKAALALAAGQALTAGVVAANVAALVKGVTSAMFLNTLKTVVTVVVAGALTAGAGLLAVRGASDDGSAPQPKSASSVPPTTKTTTTVTSQRRLGPNGRPLGGGMGPEMADSMRRVSIATMALEVAAADKSARSRAILAKLDEPISMSFANETPLEDVLKYIKSASQGPNDTGIPIYVDPASLKKVGKTMTTPVALDLEGVPLKTTLRLMLKQLDLVYCVKDGVLMIGSVEEIFQELREAQAVAERAEEIPGPSIGATPQPKAVAPPSGPRGAVRAPGSLPHPVPPAVESPALTRKLNQPITLSKREAQPLEDIFRIIGKALENPDGSGVPIYVDPSVPGMAEKLKKPVEIDFDGVPLRTSLTLLLAREGLECILQDGVLIISTNDRIENFRWIETNLAAPAGEGQAIRARLDAEITLSFPRPTPLIDVLKAIRAATRKSPGDTGLPIFVGPSFFNGTGRLTDINALEVSIDLKNVPVRVCLGLLLAQYVATGGNMHNLDGRIMDGLVVIGSRGWLDSLGPEGGRSSIGGGGFR